MSRRLLLDSHALLWWWTDSPRLSATARSAVADPQNKVWVSAASAWELALKQRLGRLEQVPPIAPRFASLVSADRFQSLAITAEHALAAAGFDSTHRDPFDRMLAAQSQLEELELVTIDPVFAEFPCRTIW